MKFIAHVWKLGINKKGKKIVCKKKNIKKTVHWYLVFLAKRVRTKHSDNANVTPNCDNTTPLLSPLCPLDLSITEGTIYLSDKRDSVSEHLNGSCNVVLITPGGNGWSTLSSYTASKVKLDTYCSGCYSPPLQTWRHSKQTLTFHIYPLVCPPQLMKHLMSIYIVL